MTYHLLDHVNRLNAAELAKPREARTNMTPGWAPPSEVVFATKPVDGFVRANMARPFPRTHSLGRGDKIRCGMPLLPGQHIHTRQLDSKHYNVCRPFDETWYSRQSDFSLLSGLAQSLLGGIARSAIPPNHGHGARCGCVDQIELKDALVALGAYHPNLIRRGNAVDPTHRDYSPELVSALRLAADENCNWCHGTGRIICDDDRAGRVSPSHKAGGYVEWQRPSSVVGHVASQVPPELAGIYATDGDPATTERRR